MALIAPDPPRPRPRGKGTGPAPACPVVTVAQSAAEPRLSGHADGTVIASVRCGPPASSSSTRTLLSCASRPATTQPAVPAPTTT
jgi:hypothetical protein